MNQLPQQFLALMILGCVTVEASVLVSKLLEKILAIEDQEPEFRQFIANDGYYGEIHTVNTDDGYILEMHRITGPKSDPSPDGKQPVLIIHGMLGCSFNFLTTGPGRALGYVLADEGYDVWLGNHRGNIFSRKHQNRTILDKEYWQFSWHENGVQDVPAMIDYILEKTNRQQLLYVGHSQGNTVFWVMTSERPEYQDKVKAMIALGPTAYVTHIRSPVISLLSEFTNSGEQLANMFGLYEFKPSGKITTKLKKTLCKDKSWALPICTNVIFLMLGPVSGQVNTTMFPALLSHVPAGASVKQFIHYGQVIQARNLMKYKQNRPPAYDLSKIKVPVYLHYSSGDWLSVPVDVHRLYKELGNPMGMFLVPYEEFSHLDFIWANDIKELLYNKVIGQLRMYKD